jgi:DNA-binding NarL/FixJ family response regulator
MAGIMKTAKHIVIECDTTRECLEQCETRNPDWVLIDIETNNINAVTLAKTIGRRFPDVHVALLSNYENEEYRRAAQVDASVQYFSKEYIDDLTQYVTSIHHSSKEES